MEHPAVLQSTLASPFARKSFYVSQNGEHSDLLQRQITVMAVAADFHRDFLTPEPLRQAERPTK